MNDKNLEQLKKEYEGIPVPQQLDFIVRQAIKKSRSNGMKKKKGFHKVALAAASAVAAVAILTVSINTSPALAKTLAQVPVVGNIVKVLTFKEYAVDDGTFNANIKVPEISGLEDEQLQNSLNEKYLQENEKLYEQFIADMEEMKENGGGHLGVDSGYVVKTDTDKILSVGRYVVNTVASSSTTFKFDTIDKENEILITLPSLFKDDSYVDVISEYIKEQMIKQHEEDDMMFYWVEGVENDGFADMFEKIAKEQSFYITSDNKLVIAFDKYEVAPGYMGNPEFVIPTHVISEILMGNEYIK